MSKLKDVHSSSKKSKGHGLPKGYRHFLTPIFRVSTGGCAHIWSPPSQLSHGSLDSHCSTAWTIQGSHFSDLSILQKKTRGILLMSKKATGLTADFFLVANCRPNLVYNLRVLIMWQVPCRDDFKVNGTALLTDAEHFTPPLVSNMEPIHETVRVWEEN